MWARLRSAGVEIPLREGEPTSSSASFRFRLPAASPTPFMSSCSRCRVNRVLRLVWLPPGLAGLVMLNWLGCKRSALVSAISSCSFSFIKRCLLLDRAWNSLSRSVEVICSHSSAARCRRKSHSYLSRSRRLLWLFCRKVSQMQKKHLGSDIGLL
jgi:hypothetical protein